MRDGRGNPLATNSVTFSVSSGVDVTPFRQVAVRPVGCPYHHMRMDYGLSLIERDVTTHPNHFVLTMDGNFLVHFALGIKPSQRRSTQRSNSGEMRTRYVILLCKLQQSGKSLVSLVENHRILLRRFSRVQ